MDGDTEELAVLEYSPRLPYDSLALLESPSSVAFNRTERMPDLPSESVWGEPRQHVKQSSDSIQGFRLFVTEMMKQAEFDCSSRTSLLLLLLLLRGDSAQGQS